MNSSCFGNLTIRGVSFQPDPGRLSWEDTGTQVPTFGPPVCHSVPPQKVRMLAPPFKSVGLAGRQKPAASHSYQNLPFVKGT